MITLAWPVFGIHAGWVVDRVDRRTLMSTANLLRAVVLAGVTVAAVTDTVPLAMILVAAGLLGTAETLVDTGLTSTVPLVVEPARRTRANARIEGTVNVTNQLAGPPLAGLLAGATLALTTGTAAGLYALAVVGIAVMTLRQTNVLPRAGNPVKVTDGLRFLWRQPIVRTLTLFTAAMNIVWAAALALLVLYAVEPGPLGLNPAGYSLMLTAMAAGGLAATMVVDRLQRTVGATRLLVVDCFGTIMLVAPVAFTTSTWAVTLGMVAAGAGASVWRILVATIRQNLTPADLLGRVYAASRVISWGVVPLGAALAGVGAELLDVRAVYVIGAAVASLVFLAFLPFALRNDLSAITSGQPTAATTAD